MSAIRSVGGSDRLLVKLGKLTADQSYYEAHQVYRTIYFRYLNGKRFQELQELLYDGAELFLRNQQFNSGADLAILFLDVFGKNPNNPSLKERPSDVDKVCDQISNLFSLIPSKSPERMQFMVTSVKLSNDLIPIKRIHYQFARTHWKEKNYAESRFHFLHSMGSCGEDCGSMLVEYHLALGYKCEVDLFIGQFVLQLLCSPCPNARQPGRIKPEQFALAQGTLQSYVAKHPQIETNNYSSLPLINFLTLLLAAIDKEMTAATFTTLCDAYSPSLSKDPVYKDYLAKIGENYFGIQSTARPFMYGIFGNIIQSLIDDGPEESEQLPATRPVPRPATQMPSSKNLKQDEEMD